MAAKAGWFPDPYDSTQFAGFRFWDGVAWTAQVSRYQPMVAQAAGTPMLRTATGAEIASLKRRFAARLLDTLLTSVLTTILGWGFLVRMLQDMRFAVLAAAQSPQQPHIPPAILRDAAAASSSYAVVSAAVTLAYYAVTTGAFSGTPGKLALGLRVVRQDGSRVRWWQAIVRALVASVAYLGGLVLPVLASLGWVMNLAEWITAMVSGRKQAIHDLAAQTLVVRRL